MLVFKKVIDNNDVKGKIWDCPLSPPPINALCTGVVPVVFLSRGSAEISSKVVDGIYDVNGDSRIRPPTRI